MASLRRPRPQRPWRRAGEASAAGAGQTPPDRNAEWAAEGAAGAAHRRKRPRYTSAGPASPRRAGFTDCKASGGSCQLFRLTYSECGRADWQREPLVLSATTRAPVRRNFPSRLPLLYGLSRVLSDPKNSGLSTQQRPLWLPGRSSLRSTPRFIPLRSRGAERSGRVRRSVAERH